MHGAIPHFTNTSSWRGAELKKAQGQLYFTFTLLLLLPFTFTYSDGRPQEHWKEPSIAPICKRVIKLTGKYSEM
jgi:hypothetical protein